jgi:hypothetical protein
MDGESFDRLSVVIHRLGERATRRGALGLVLGGSLTAAGGLFAEDAGAHKNNKHRRNSNRKNRNCWGGRCWNNSGRRNQCGGRTCQNGWGCCNQGGVSVCVPNTFPVCCGNHSFSSGYSCCGGNSGACVGGLNTCTGQFGVCCQPGWKHCQNSFSSTCIPDHWDCDRFFYQSSQSAGVEIESSEEIPTADPVEVPAGDYIQLS